MSLNDIIQVSILLEKAAVVAQGFGVPLIAGPSSRFSERFRIYTDVDSMIADGFLTTDPEYLSAASIFSQPQSPSTIVVGRRLTAVAQLNTITPTAVNTHVYTITINGTSVSYTSDADATAAEISTGLVAAMAANATVTAAVQGAVVGSTFTITARQAGIGFSYATTDLNLANVATTASVGIANDLQAFKDAGAAWYGTTMTSRDTNEILAAAAWVQASSDVPYIFVPQSSQATSKSMAYNPDATIATDLFSALHRLGYTRTAPLWHALDGEYAAAAWVGAMLPFSPGSATWALKSLVGITVDTLSATEQSNMIGKSANFYYPLTSQNSITKNGTMASSDWIDAIISVDWLKANISAAVANLFLTSPKVPYDDDGISQIAAQVRGVLQIAESAPFNMLAKVPKFSVVQPKASAISGSNRLSRVLFPPITFAAQLSGAIQDAKITGKVG